MARSEARILVEIWDDPDFVALSPTGQRMYMFLLSQADLAHTGVLALRERRWSRKAAGLTVEQIGRDLDELAQGRFVVVDEDAEEILIRSFIRRDKVFRQPNVLRAAADHLALVTSPAIRAELAAEVDRIAAEEKMTDNSAAIIREMQEALRKGSGNPSPNPSGNPSANPSANPSVHRETSKHSPAMWETDASDSEYVGPSIGAGVKGSRNPSRKGSRLRPGDRGEGTAVTTDSPNPNPHTPSDAARSKTNAPSKTEAADAAAREERQRSKAITDAYTAVVKLSNWPAINGIVLKAVKADEWTDDEIHAAMMRLAAEGRTVTTETLRIELAGKPAYDRNRNTNSGWDGPWMNPDPADYDDWQPHERENVDELP